MESSREESRETEHVIGSKTETPVCAEVTETPVCAEVTETPACAEVTETPACAEVTETPACAEVTETPACAEVTETPACAEVTETPACAEVTETPVCAEVTETPVCAEVTETPVCAEVTKIPVCAEVISEISSDGKITDTDAATGTLRKDTTNDAPAAELACVASPGEETCKHSHHEEKRVSESAETELGANAPLGGEEVNGGVEVGAEHAHLGVPAGSPHAHQSPAEDAPAENDIIAAAAEPSSSGTNSASRPQTESGVAPGDKSALLEAPSKFAGAEERSASGSGDDRADSRSAPVSSSSEDSAEEFKEVVEKPVFSPSQGPGSVSCGAEPTDAASSPRVSVSAGPEECVEDMSTTSAQECDSSCCEEEATDTATQPHIEVVVRRAETTSEETTFIQTSGSVLCEGEPTDSASSRHIEVATGREETAEDETRTASIQRDGTEMEAPIVRAAEALEDSQDQSDFLESCVLAAQLDFEYVQAQDVAGSALAIPVEPVEEILKDGFTGKAFKKEKFKIKIKRKGDCRLS
ncbi:uncharacterized protein LOC134070981 [Sardina pilchardus]|uniref:uncharacterized protein LOC134070981 n=1 Tax=Sardina pilchardus TaxID=27697 RepID=UPI002E11E640